MAVKADARKFLTENGPTPESQCPAGVPGHRYVSRFYVRFKGQEAQVTESQAIYHLPTHTKEEVLTTYFETHIDEIRQVPYCAMMRQVPQEYTDTLRIVCRKFEIDRSVGSGGDNASQWVCPLCGESMRGTERPGHLRNDH